MLCRDLSGPTVYGLRTRVVVRGEEDSLAALWATQLFNVLGSSALSQSVASSIVGDQHILGANCHERAANRLATSSLCFRSGSPGPTRLAKSPTSGSRSEGHTDLAPGLRVIAARVEGRISGPLLPSDSKSQLFFLPWRCFGRTSPIRLMFYPNPRSQ